MDDRPSCIEEARDLYIRSEKPVSLRQLVDIFKGRRSASLSELTKQSRFHGWVQQREKFQKELRKKTDKAIQKKIVETKVKTLGELNLEHLGRAEQMIEIGMQLIEQSTVVDKKTGKISYTLSTADFRRIQASILEAQAAVRLYHNLNPTTPVPEKENNTGDVDEIAALFADILPPAQGPANA